MADKKNLCAQIGIALHNRVTEEKDRLEMTTSQYIASLLTEYYKMKDENAGHLGWRSHDLRHHGKEAAGGSARRPFPGAPGGRPKCTDALWKGIVFLGRVRFVP
jgi:hypothetical protein